MNKSEMINELAAALSKAQAAIKGAIKDSNNPFFKSQYADLSSVWEACREQLTSNGLSIVQCPEESENGVAIETMLCHSSGQWISSKYHMPVEKLNAQAVGSAITYARRYALSAMVGIAPLDDDGNDVTLHKPAAKKETQPKTLAPYPLKDFDANKSEWHKIVESGKKTADQLIAMITTRGTLTDDQKKLIKSWELVTEDVPQ
ncbi:MAG: ERF family protein [Nitrosomonas sp.]|nr:ERF family protein [Nitrosomonas sp.]